jgi:hypothetical protein
MVTYPRGLAVQEDVPLKRSVCARNDEVTAGYRPIKEEAVQLEVESILAALADLERLVVRPGWVKFLGQFAPVGRDVDSLAKLKGAGGYKLNGKDGVTVVQFLSAVEDSLRLR